MKTNESGRSMIEMLGVLAIIGVLSVGGIAGYSKAMSVYKVNRTIDQITQITTNTRALFSGHKTFVALTKDNKPNMTLIKKSHLVPDDMINGDAMENAFGGSVTLIAAKKGDTDNKAFSITYTTIPQAPCMELVTKDWGHGRSSGLYSIKINNTVVYKVDSSTATDKDPIDITKALTNCSSPYTNTIEWVFY